MDFRILICKLILNWNVFYCLFLIFSLSLSLSYLSKSTGFVVVSLLGPLEFHFRTRCYKGSSRLLVKVMSEITWVQSLANHMAWFFSWFQGWISFYLSRYTDSSNSQLRQPKLVIPIQGPCCKWHRFPAMWPPLPNSGPGDQQVDGFSPVHSLAFCCFYSSMEMSMMDIAVFSPFNSVMSFLCPFLWFIFAICLGEEQQCRNLLCLDMSN